MAKIYVIYIFVGFTRHLMNNNDPHFALTLCFLKDNIHKVLLDILYKAK